jgi:hypothetical protein
MVKTVKDGADLKSALSQLEDTLKVYLVDKAPSLPEAAKEVIVKYGPWITLILLVISLPAILFAFGLGAVVAPFAFLGGLQAGVNFGFGMIFSAAILVIEAFAISGLFKRKLGAWRLMLYATLLGGVQALISFNLGGLIIGTGLSLYILFQIKSYYK